MQREALTRGGGTEPLRGPVPDLSEGKETTDRETPESTCSRAGLLRREARRAWLLVLVNKCRVQSSSGTFGSESDGAQKEPSATDPRGCCYTCVLPTRGAILPAGPSWSVHLWGAAGPPHPTPLSHQSAGAEARSRGREWRRGAGAQSISAHPASLLLLMQLLREELRGRKCSFQLGSFSHVKLRWNQY